MHQYTTTIVSNDRDELHHVIHNLNAKFVYITIVDSNGCSIYPTATIMNRDQIMFEGLDRGQYLIKICSGDGHIVTGSAVLKR